MVVWDCQPIMNFSLAASGVGVEVVEPAQGRGGMEIKQAWKFSGHGIPAGMGIQQATKTTRKKRS